jgi:hypothetical protein
VAQRARCESVRRGSLVCCTVPAATEPNALMLYEYYPAIRSLHIVPPVGRSRHLVRMFWSLHIVHRTRGLASCLNACFIRRAKTPSLRRELCRKYFSCLLPT